MDSDDLTRSHGSSIASSSDGDQLFASTSLDEACEDDENSGCALSDSEAGDPDDFAYYQDVYRFVNSMKNEYERVKDNFDSQIQKTKEEVKEELQKKTSVVKEAYMTQKEKLRQKSREHIDLGKKKIYKLRKKTYKRLKQYEPDEDYRQRLWFTKSVLTVMIKTFATTAAQWLLPWYYAISCPLLITARIITYWQCQFQYFCLDYCYFGNLIISLILWLNPSSPELCALQFSIANGMLYAGAFSFRNSLVFHSVDKMTSTYIHTVPLLLTFGIRWYPRETSRYWHSSFPEVTEASVQWNIIAPFIVMVVHSIIYTLLVNVILQPAEHIATSYRYLKAKKSTKAIFGANPPYCMFVLVNYVMCLVMSALTMILYQSFAAHSISLLVLTVYVTWNGAGYYFDVFRMSMVTKSEMKQE